MNLRALLPLAGLLLVAAIPPAPVDETARAKELMKPFEGKWESEMYFMGMGPMKGTEEVKLVSGGIVGLVTAGGDMGPGMKFEGHGMFGYDPHTKVWSHVWCDNQDPGLSVSQGTWSADGKSFTVEAEMDMGMGAGPQKMLMVNTFTGDGTREFKMMTKDSKPDLPPMMKAKYTRTAN